MEAVDPLGLPPARLASNATSASSKSRQSLEEKKISPVTRSWDRSP